MKVALALAQVAAVPGHCATKESLECGSRSSTFKGFLASACSLQSLGQATFNGGVVKVRMGYPPGPGAK